MAEWLAASLDLGGATKAFLTPKNLKITRRLNGAAEATFDLDYEADEPPDVLTGNRAIALYRDGTVRFAGPVVGRTLSGGPDGGRRMSVTARDPFAVLERRALTYAYLATFTGAVNTNLDDVVAETGHTHSDGTVTASADFELDGSGGLFSAWTGQSNFTTAFSDKVAGMAEEWGSNSIVDLEVVFNRHSTVDWLFKGVVYAWDSSSNNGYVLWLGENGTTNGQVVLDRLTAGVTTNILTHDGGDADGTGQKTVRVIHDLSDGAWQVFINGELLGSGTDTTYTSGGLGFAHYKQTTNESSTTGIHIDEVRVRPGLAYSSLDAGQIARELLRHANMGHETHLRTGTIDTSVNRDRTYELGKNIGEAIVQLAEASSGFWFRVDPSLSGAQMGTLEVEYGTGNTASGIDQPDVHFAYGAGAFDNLESYSLEEEPPVNYVFALGETDAESGVQLTATATDASSIANYGRWGEVVSFVDVSEQATLDAHAEEALETEPRKVYAVQPIASGIVDSVRAPRLWDDFEVGDAVRLSIADGGVDVFDLDVRVLSAAVAISDDGEIERLEGLELEVIA